MWRHRGGRILTVPVGNPIEQRLKLDLEFGGRFECDCLRMRDRRHDLRNQLRIDEFTMIRAILEGQSDQDEKPCLIRAQSLDRKSTRLNSSHLGISYAVFCLKKK